MEIGIQGEHICIVDDQAVVLRALKRELSEYAEKNNLTILTFTSVSECLKQLEELHPQVSVVISDLKMPELSGSDFLISLKELYPGIQAILLTAYNEMAEIQKAISATICALLLKPWNPDILESEINKAREIYRIKRDNAEYTTQIRKQLEIAGEFQSRLLDSTTTEMPGLSIELTYIPLPKMMIGGDYYDFIRIDEDRMFFLVGDVTGHGIKPAFITAILKVIVLNISKDPELGSMTPAQLQNTLNRQLCNILVNTSDVLIAFTTLLVDTREMKLSYANAGHLPVYIIQDDNCTAYHIEGPALGFSPEITYDQKDVPLQSGNIIALYTDGLLEPANHNSHFSNDEILQYLVQSSRATSFNTYLIEKMRLVRKKQQFHDDITVLSVKIQ